MSIVDTLVSLDPDDRAAILDEFTNEERTAIARLMDWEANNPWRRWENDPVGFVTQGLGEELWSKQVEILESVRDNRRTVVPACHAPGKSHLAARAVAWWISCHAPGTARVVTTASTFRQVRGVLWPHIRRVAARHNLPGDVFTVEWKLDGTMVADGFSPAEYNETAVQGIHAPHLLVIVDEAGGVGPNLGRALEALMTGDHTRLLVLGNPPVDRENTWFQRLCSSPMYNVIPIAAQDTPAWTGEATGACKSCPPDTPTHNVVSHLVDKAWVDEVIAEFGVESPFVEARVFARFPEVSANKVMPMGWLEAAADLEIQPPDDIRLGVDVAADGGDEFAIAWADGMNVKIVYHASGAVNANAVDVAGKVMEFIVAACDEVKTRSDRLRRVRVKIDSIGVGWGVAGLLKTWVAERSLPCDVIAVNVAEKPRDTSKFRNQRAEMWWNGRLLIQPEATVRLDIDRKVLAQLTTPTYGSDSAGRIQIEKKDSMRKRGVGSPDRAEAVLLALYEPPGYLGVAPAPVGFSQTNEWNVGAMRF